MTELATAEILRRLTALEARVDELARALATQLPPVRPTWLEPGATPPWQVTSQGAA